MLTFHARLILGCDYAETDAAIADGMLLSQSQLDLTEMGMDGISPLDAAGNGLEKTSSGLGSEPFKLGIDLSRLKLIPRRYDA